ncbi:MAG: sulfate adenylyltransferase, partial [Acidobacteria bacterium]|nr:sulfate adenylyltransferase [Acidobacteriota bacterium]
MTISKTALISPYGGSLVDLMVPADERAEVFAHASRLPSLTLSDRALHDLELLATGAFSPLRTFLGKASYERVLDEMRLEDGTLWPIPVTLTVPADLVIALDSEIALRTSKNELVGILTVAEVFDVDLAREARAVLGTNDSRHPLVAEMTRWGTRAVSGPLRVLSLPDRPDFADLRRTPGVVREELASRGREAVVAFQTRNPLHRSHEELTKRAASSTGGTLLIHPVVGLTKPGDVDHYTRVRTYRALVDNHYDSEQTLLSLLPLAMRMAGPREALWHALIRRNYGVSHFIVGRDHASPGNDSTGKPFYGPYDAQELLRQHAEEIGVAPVVFQEMVYLPEEDRYEEHNQVPEGAKTLSISGTAVREQYLDKGVALPEWFTRKETAEILRTAYHTA